MTKITACIISVAVSIVIITSVLIPFCNVGNNSANVLDVVIIDGQSNAAYRSVFNAEELNEDYSQYIPTKNLYYYGTALRPVMYGYNLNDCDIHKTYNNGWKIGGYEPLLSYNLSNRSNHDILIINVGIGAKSIEYLAPTGESGQWAFSVIEDALSKVQGYDNINMLCWIWAQGENDKDMPVDTYKQYFYSLQNSYKAIGANECYIIATRPYYGGNATTAQNELILSDPGVILGTNLSNTFTTGSAYLQYGEPIHYSQIGRNVIALELGNIISVSEIQYSNEIKTILTAIPLIVVITLLLGVSVAIFKKINSSGNKK